MIARRHILQLGAAAAGSGLLAAREASAGDTVHMVCGFGVGNPTDLCVQLIGDGFSAALDQPVTLDYAIGEAGKLAALRVIDARPDGKTLLVAEILNLALHDAAGANLLPRLRPIAKITRGFSTALAVNEYSDIKDWPGLLASARAGRLKAATTGHDSTVGLLLALVERRMKLSFEALEVAGTNAAVEMLLTRRADLAVVDTRTVLLHNARDRTKLRVIATSGARRSPQSPSVPTLGELVGDPKLAYTISFGLFAPAATAPSVAGRLTAALVGLRNDKSVQVQARLANIPMEFDGPSAIAEAVARDRRIAADIAR
jgi:tripartite-type tricarboxylate transporter receptor subunit TctC